MRAWYRRHRTDVLLAAVVLVLAGPIVQALQAHQASRLAFTAALWDQRTIQLDAYGPGGADVLGVDLAQRDGHLYSDKAPGQPFFALPFYALARTVGADPATDNDVFGNLTLWWVSLWSAAVPAAALAVLMRHAAMWVASPRAAVAAALATAAGTLLLPFASVLFGHVLAGCLGFAAYVVVREDRASPRRLVLGGVLAGLAVLVEFTMAIVVLVLGVLAVLKHRERVLAYVAGGVPAGVALLAYNTAAFGAPLSFSYDHSRTFGEFHAQGLFGIQFPSVQLTSEVLAGERGLLLLTPIVAVGVLGLVLLIMRGGRAREVGTIGLSVFALFVLVQAGWFNPTGGASPGPRYVVPALPFLAAGVAEVYDRFRALMVVSAWLSVVPMVLATYTNPLAQPTETAAIGHWVWRVFNDRLADSLLTMLWTDWGLLVQLAAAALLAASVMRSAQPRVTAGVPVRRRQARKEPAGAVRPG